MRISDWSSDVCSSDLPSLPRFPLAHARGRFRLSRFGRQLPGLFDRFVDAADHVEGSFGQLVIFAIDHRLEALDRIFQLDELAGDTGEHFGHEEGMSQEELYLVWKTGG